jgi:phage terminase small subunit
MSGRKPTAARNINNKTHKKPQDEIDTRIEAEPIWNSQVFAIPEDLTSQEQKKWNEVIAIIRATENSPNSDADKDTIVNYIKAWCRFINADKVYQKNPEDKENYRQMMDNAKLLDKLKSDLMLDPVSRARMGLARVESKKKISPIDEILNRQGK